MSMQLMALPTSTDPVDATQRVRGILAHAREVTEREPKKMLELLDFVDSILDGMGSTMAHAQKAFGGLFSTAVGNG